MKVLHVISSLKQGGAQVVLRDLVRRMHGFENEVIALLPDRTMVPSLEAAGAGVTCIDLRRPPAVAQLYQLMRRARPDVVQTWLHQADLVAGAIARMNRMAPVVWGIHNRILRRGEAHLVSRGVLKACAWTSRWIPERIVCVAEATRADHVRAGFDGTKMLVIPNGFDLDLFRPDDSLRAEMRRSLGIPSDVVVLSLVARYHPMKDHATFIRAASLIARSRPNVRFVLSGDGIDAGNTSLMTQIRDAGIESRTLLLGIRDDVPRLMTAVDIACLSSSSEALPNAIGEAMAAAVPVVTTDVGDAAALVGECGEVVPAGDAEAFAAASQRLIEIGPEGRRRLGTRSRERIRQHFSIDSAVARYEALYAEVIAAL